MDRAKEIERNQVRDELLGAIKVAFEANWEGDKVLLSILDKIFISIRKDLGTGIFSEKEVQFFERLISAAQQCLS